MNKLPEKKFPCEECREQKRKCNCKNPCDRCERFKLKCVYVRALSPRDQEFIRFAREKELRTEIESLTDQVDTMHEAITTLRNHRQQHYHQQLLLSPPESLSFDEDCESINNSIGSNCEEGCHFSSRRFVGNPSHCSSKNVYTPEQSVPADRSSINTNISGSSYIRKKARRNVIAREGSVSISLLRNTKRSKTWTLSLRRDGGMVIETFVSKYSDLLPHLHAMTTMVNAQGSVPYTFSTYSTFDALLRALNTMILNKYGKTTCRSSINALRMRAATEPQLSAVLASNMDNRSKPKADNSSTCLEFEAIPLLSLEPIIFQLLDAYVNCLYYHDFAIHIPTFNTMFVYAYPHITQSPAALALCASICVFPCHHITHILPPGTCRRYGHHFYNLAREHLADRFDDVCLETFATYVFLSVYEMGIHNGSQSSSMRHYTQLAHRMADILQSDYAKAQIHNSEIGGETTLYHRLRTYLLRVQTYELAMEFRNNDRDMRETGYAQFYAMCLNQADDVWVLAPDDTELAHSLVEMHQYVQILRREIYKSSRAFISTMPRDLCELTETVIQQQVKDAMGRWYTHTLPQRLRLSLPLLSAVGIPEELYFNILMDEMEVKGMAPVLTALALYEESLLIVQSYFHKRLHGPETSWSMLRKYWQGGKLILDSEKRKLEAGDKWARRIDKLLSVKPMIDFNGTDDEFFHMIMSVMFPPEGRTSILFVAVQSASNALRLLRFIQKLPSYRCFFDVRVLMDAWVVLMRSLRFEQFFDENEQVLLPSIRQGLEDCLKMAKKEFRDAELGISAHIQSMERELREHYKSFPSSSVYSIPTPTGQHDDVAPVI